MKIRSRRLKSRRLLSYLAFCNVLHIYGCVRAIPTYRIYRLYDECRHIHRNKLKTSIFDALLMVQDSIPTHCVELVSHNPTLSHGCKSQASVKYKPHFDMSIRYTAKQIQKHVQNSQNQR